MRTALISDYQIQFNVLSPIFRLMEKHNIRFDPLVKLPLANGANVVDFHPSLKNYGYEELNTEDKPDAVVYLAGKDKKNYDVVKMFYNKSVKILYLKINEAGVLEKCW